MSFHQSLAMRSLGKEQGDAILKGFFGPTASYNAIRDKRIELMDVYVAQHGVDLKPGIRELLEFLQESEIPAAITSSSPLDRIQDYLAFHQLDGYFAALCSGRDTPRGKPEPDIYLHGAASIGVDPRFCLGLEDSPAGILSTYRAGCLPVLIPDLDQPSEETKALLFAKADSLLDIIDLIKQQNGCL
jgi:HAD superfamily hydrolase (TIGR01509 family)